MVGTCEAPSRTMRLWPIPRDAACAVPRVEVVLSSIRETRRALVDIGANRFGLVCAADQLLLLDGLCQQRRTWIDRQLVEHALGGADRIGTLAGNFAGDLQGRRARIVANSRCEPVGE